MDIRTIENLIKKSEKGDSFAQYHLSLCYESKSGYNDDYCKVSMYWLTKSAEQNNHRAQYRLGVIFTTGKYHCTKYQVKINLDLGIFW
jgi:TPR repeat protein